MHYLRSHIRIVAAFTIREMSTRYGRSPGGYIWAILEPVAYVAMMSALFGTFARIPPLGESFPLFFATGFIAYNFYSGMSAYLSSAISGNKNLLSYPNVAPIDPVVGRAFLQGTTSLAVAFIILLGARHGETHPHTIVWYALLDAVLFAWMLAAGISLFNIVLFERFPLYEKIFGIMTRPLFMLSGVFYVPSQMPHPFQEILLDNPISQVIILFREGFYGASLLDGLDLWYLLESSSLLFFAGFLTFTFFPVGRLR